MRNRTRRNAGHFKTRMKNFRRTGNAALVDSTFPQQVTVSLFLNRMVNATYVRSPLYCRSLGSNPDDPPL